MLSIVIRNNIAEDDNNKEKINKLKALSDEKDEAKLNNTTSQ